MAGTLADGRTVPNSSVADVSIRLFGQSASLDLSARFHVLDYLSSDLVFGMDWI